MTVFVATTTMSIQRGVSGTNEWGDEVPSTVTVATGLEASVIEGLSTGGSNTQIAYQPVDMRGGVLELFTVRFRPDADIREDDRMVDERTSAVYQARAVYHPQSVFGLADVRVVAVRTAAISESVNG